MPKNTYYFPHDCNAHDDVKLRALKKKYGCAGYGQWWLLCEFLRAEDNCRLPYSDLTFDGLADVYGIEPSEVKSFIDDCIMKFRDEGVGLLAKKDSYFYAPRQLRDFQDYESKIEMRRKAGRISAERRAVPTVDIKVEESGSSIIDDKLKGMIAFYESEIGMVTPGLLERIKDASNTYPDGWFEKAVAEAVLYGSRNLKYIETILERWHTRGIKVTEKKDVAKMSTRLVENE